MELCFFKFHFVHIIFFSLINRIHTAFFFQRTTRKFVDNFNKIYFENLQYFNPFALADNFTDQVHPDHFVHYYLAGRS